MGNTTEQRTLLEGAAAVLSDRLPSNWIVTLAPAGSGDPNRAVDGTLVLTQPNGAGTTFAVEARSAFAPRDVSTVLSGLGRAVRALASGVPLLVVAPWIGRRAQELLTAEGINYVDLTGNVRVQLDYPALFISSVGAARDPVRRVRGRARLRGPKAGRLIRTLVDARPPYGVRSLAEATGLTPGYVSQMLQTLDREALIERSPRGGVDAVDVAALLRHWAETYDVLRSNVAQAYIAPDGASEAYVSLATLPDGVRTAVTGSFAAVHLAPVAAPSQLVVYCDDASAVARGLRLLPADEGANVILLKPFDPVVWVGTGRRAAVTEVAPSQIVADCLTGTGRMPAEGEAVLGRLTAGEEWRRSLDELVFPWSDGA